MSSILIIVFTLLAFSAGYRYYAKKLSRVWQVDPNRPTPAVSRCDGVDFVPAKNWVVLFGHHFASIAGAGPVVGPIIAVMIWGWVPAVLWVVLGAVFLGGVHDFGSLMISVREDGASVGDIAARVISKRAKVIMLIFLWLALLLVIAVFAYLAANTFVTQPKIIAPSLGIIPVAVFTGFALYRLKWPVGTVTACGLGMLVWLIFLGEQYPVVLSADAEKNHALWTVVLLGYCYAASILPVNILLQPRDYLSSFLLAGGIFLALAGICVSRPELTAPAFIAAKGPANVLWPMMFITIACGANSGFHSLIASGTTSKQLPNERYARRIGYGAMLVEGLLAVIVIILVTGAFSQAEFKQHVFMKTSPVNLYGLAFGRITAPFLGGWGTFIALAILNAFILTTLDTAARITRYITQELTGIKNRYLSTLIIVLAGALLALGKDNAHQPLWQSIWPVFGASNQLTAGLALLVISAWLISKNRPTIYALAPAIFMLVTSMAALAIQLVLYWKSGQWVLVIISIVLLGTAVFLAKEVSVLFQKSIRNTKIFMF